MVPVYHCLYEEGVLVLLCVVNRQLEAASISDLVTINYVCGFKVLILSGSYPSAASTHRGQVVWGGGGGGGGMAGMRPPVILYISPKRACLRRLARGGRFKSCSIQFTQPGSLVLQSFVMKQAICLCTLSSFSMSC